MRNNNNESLKSIIKRLEEFSYQLEKLKFRDYVVLMQNKRRLLFLNFIAGLARGLGMAIGFTLLGGLVIYFLSRLASQNLPLIGDFIAELVEIVEDHLS